MWVARGNRPRTSSVNPDDEPPVHRDGGLDVACRREDVLSEGYFSDERRQPVAEVTSARASVRAVRLSDPPAVRFELRDEIGIAVHLNETFAITRRCGSRLTDRVGTFGEAFVDVPGERVDVSVRGECRAAQFAIPVPALMAVLEEDHGISPDPSGFGMLRVEAWPRLVRTICLGLTEPDAEEDVRREVAACLSHLWQGGTDRPRLRSGLAPARLRRVREFVEADLSTVTLGGMAAQAALSPYHFSREFRRETGSAPWEYVVTRRLAKAFALLGGTGMALDDVARRSGFSHASHLQRHLRARFGAPAGTIRRRLLP